MFNFLEILPDNLKIFLPDGKDRNQLIKNGWLYGFVSERLQQAKEIVLVLYGSILKSFTDELHKQGDTDKIVILYDTQIFYTEKRYLKL